MKLQRAPRPHRQWLEVGPGKGYSYSNVQSALDAVVAAGDASEENPYLITVAPGTYDLGNSPVVHFASHTHVIGAGPRASRLVKTSSTGADSNLGAYNIGAGAPGTPGVTRNVTLSGIAILNRMAGGAATGLPPEPALSIGKNADANQVWDDIHVENCHVIGNHDGLQVFNYNTQRGKLFVRSNYIAALHDAFTLKCVGEVFSSGNQIVANDTGFSALAGAGYSLEPWKTTGIHFGVQTPGLPVDPLLDKFVSVGDSIVVRGTGQSFGSSGTPNQRYCCGVLWYNGSQNVYPSRFVGLSIDVRYSETVVAAPTVGGVVLETGVVGASDGYILFQGGQIHVDQAGASGTAPAAVACVRVGGGPSTTRHVRLAGTILGGRNAQAAGVCWAMQTIHANARITSAVYTTLANDVFAGSSITPWAPA